MWAQSQGAQVSLPAVMPPGYPMGNSSGAPPFFNGGGDPSSWGAYAQPGVGVDPTGEAPKKKAKTDNGEGSSANGSEDGSNNADI